MAGYPAHGDFAGESRVPVRNAAGTPPVRQDEVAWSAIFPGHL